MDARPPQVPFTLAGRRLGALPLINQIAGRMGLARLLDKHMALPDVRMRLTPATVIQIVIANLVLCHRPLYALAEWAAPYDAHLLGLQEGDALFLTDDRIGRALDLLFDADRGALLTELIVGVVGEFSLDLSQLHNDSTSIKLQGEFAGLDGSVRGAKPTAAAARGHSKDHRPDLPQLACILTVSCDGAVPVTYRLADGNTNDDPTHIPTWDTLVTLTGTPDFLYVADCKLASTEAMTHIDSHGGRFVTVLPRTRALQGRVPDHLGALHRQAQQRRRRPPGENHQRARGDRRAQHQARRAALPHPRPRHRRASPRRRPHRRRRQQVDQPRHRRDHLHDRQEVRARQAPQRRHHPARRGHRSALPGQRHRR